MEHRIETKGYFWVPSEPRDQLAGILRFNQFEGIVLELFGQFTTFIKIGSRDNNFILGFTPKGEKLTLMKCFEYSRSFGVPGFPLSSISAVYLFWGEHFTSTEQLFFDKMSIVYEDINTWLDISGFEKPLHNRDKKEIVLKYQKPQDLEYEVNPGWKVGVDFSFFSQLEYFIPTEMASIKQVPEVVIRPVKKGKFDDFLKHFQSINSFLAICYFTFPIIKSVEFSLQICEEEEISGEKFIKVALYFHHGIDYKKYSKHDSAQRFLLTFKDLALPFELVISKWFLLFDKIEASIKILSNCFMNRKESTEFYFLGLCQAMENMHRRLSGNDRMSFLNRLEAMIEALPGNVRTGLLSNESNFAERIRNNRNYFTHYDASREESKASLNELFLLSEKMKIIIIAHLIMEIGFSQVQAEQIIIEKSGWLFNHLIQRHID